MNANERESPRATNPDCSCPPYGLARFRTASTIQTAAGMIARNPTARHDSPSVPSSIPIHPRDPKKRHGTPIHAASMRHASVMNGAQAFFLA